jgi:hypothetical protein
MVAIQDETGENLCPTGKSTFAQNGAIEVPLIGLDDKRQYSLGKLFFNYFLGILIDCARINRDEKRFS